MCTTCMYITKFIFLQTEVGKGGQLILITEEF